MPFGINYYRPGTGWAPQVWKKFDPQASRDDFKRMQELDVNCVRVFLTFGSFYQESGVLSQDGLRKFDQFIAMAEEAGIYVHPTGPDHWEDMPSWARGDGYATEKTIEARESFWRLFAARYRGRNVIFAYDLLNEPAVGWSGDAMRVKWNQWLDQHYSTREKTAAAWGISADSVSWGDVAAPDPKDANPKRMLDYQHFRESVADEWTRRQAAAIKAADPDALVTVGFIQWSVPVHLPGVQQYAAFRPQRQAQFLDFLEIHYYPLDGGFYEYDEKGELRNLSCVESLVREMAHCGKPVVVAEFGWYGGGKLSINQGRHAPASEADQARWCSQLIETTKSFACGWLNWGFYDQPEARDVSQLTGLLTADGTVKAWGSAFREQARALATHSPPTRKIGPRPEFDWDRALTDRPYAEAYRGAYLDAFKRERSTGLREESFDGEPPNWEGINNRSTHFPIRTVTQDFGYNPTSARTGGQPGEIGGIINPAAEPAYYGYRLPRPLSLDDAMKAGGNILVARGPGHFLLGFFNPTTLNEWRTPNTLAARINGRGDHFHVHIEYCTQRWRCEAGVVGQIVRGERIEARNIPSDRVYRWELAYDPKAHQITFTLGNDTATCSIVKEHLGDGAVFTHFGLFPVLKSWDDPGEVWLDNINVNGVFFDFSKDPGWQANQNRRTYKSFNTRPRFDFGWSQSHWAGGKAAGELGGLIFRGDCREPARLAAYGDRLPILTLRQPLQARGKVCVRRAVSDSTASIGFYNAASSLRSNPAQDQSIPMDYLGINIEGPSSEGFFFYPVYRAHGQLAGALGSDGSRAPRIYPDGKTRDWTLRYNPAGAGGRGQITVTLDGQTGRLSLDPRAKEIGAAFNRFGICTPWIDGNSVTVFFDDLQYTARE